MPSWTFCTKPTCVLDGRRMATFIPLSSVAHTGVWQLKNVASCTVKRLQRSPSPYNLVLIPEGAVRLSYMPYPLFQTEIKVRCRWLSVVSAYPHGFLVSKSLTLSSAHVSTMGGIRHTNEFPPWTQKGGEVDTVLKDYFS